MKFRIFALLILFISMLALYSCSSTRDMQVKVTKPAIFELPKNVKRILLVDRSKGNTLSFIEGVLTGELPGTDKIQSQQCISGLQETLNLNRELEITRHPVRLSSDRGNSTGFGNPLDWNLITQLSQQYNADALLVLEFFDTDFSVKDGYNQGQNFFSAGTAKAKAGFRLYDPQKQTILYERSFTSYKYYRENSTTKLAAIAKLIKGSDALNEVSKTTGQNFAKRLIIYNVWEDRVMFKIKNNTEAKRAERLVLSQNWQAGIDSWLGAFKNTNSSEEKGKIAYNLALGYEVLGDLNEAKKWITTSYVDYQTHKSLGYSQILDKRIENEGILEGQVKRQNP